MKSPMIAAAAAVLLMAGTAQSSAQESYAYLTCALIYNGEGQFETSVVGAEVAGKTTVAAPVVGDSCTAALAQLGQGKLCILDGIFFHEPTSTESAIESATSDLGSQVVGIKEILLTDCGKL